MLPLWILSFIVPVAGHLVYVAFGFLFSATYLALDYTDWPASRRDERIRVRLARARAHRWAYLGFGAMVSVLLFVPIISLFLMPAAVAGGTRLFLDVTGEGSPRPGFE
jgi:CysZ protein